MPLARRSLPARPRPVRPTNITARGPGTKPIRLGQDEDAHLYTRLLKKSSSRSEAHPTSGGKSLTEGVGYASGLPPSNPPWDFFSSLLHNYLVNAIFKPVAGDAGRFAGVFTTRASFSTLQSSFAWLPNNWTEATAFSASFEVRPREVIRI